LKLKSKGIKLQYYSCFESTITQLSKERLIIYNRKLEFIKTKINLITHQNNLDSNETELDAFLYRLQSSIDAGMDLITMICKDLGLNPIDDYTNLDILLNHRYIDKETNLSFKRLNGLRNVIVHKYNGVDVDLILENKELIIKTLHNIVLVIENGLNSISKSDQK
jgi:uncharacterized protein YutE (UPF0331/DUF86 family)